MSKRKNKPDYRVAAYQADPTIADTLPDILKEILHLHYIKCLKWSEVADATNYSVENIYLLRRQALSLLEVVIDGKHERE